MPEVSVVSCLKLPPNVPREESIYTSSSEFGAGVRAIPQGKSVDLNCHFLMGC